jgi:hypothetical protein
VKRAGHFAIGDRVAASFKMGSEAGRVVGDLGPSVTSRWLVLADGDVIPEGVSLRGSRARGRQGREPMTATVFALLAVNALFLVANLWMAEKNDAIATANLRTARRLRTVSVELVRARFGWGR